MSSIQELLDQRAEIDAQIAAAKADALAGAVGSALTVFTDAGFTQQEAAAALIRRFNKGVRKATGAKLPVKYRQVSGTATWSGRGIKPNWFVDGDYVEV